MLYLALDCDYINENKFNDLSIECKIISSMLYKYIKKIQAL
jgi:four helix bundle protein